MIPAHSGARSTTSSAPAVAGPADRESFFAIQARDRRASWKIAAACVLSAAIMTGALVLTLVPPLVALAILGADAVSLIAPATPNVVELLGAAMSSRGLYFVALALTLGPGLIITFVAWRTVRPLTLRAEAGGLLARVPTRDPKPGDLEEHQIANVVSEMAVAAGLEPPRVQLIDRPDLQAFAVGGGPAAATIIVTRGLLDTLDREETQAIIGHLVASIGNGDLAIAQDILTTYGAVGLVERLPFAPLDSSVRDWITTLLRASRSSDATEAERLPALMAELYRHPGQQDEVFSGDRFLDRLRRRTPTVSWFDRLPTKVASALAAPLLYVSMAQIMCRLALLDLLVNPLLGLLWRRRRLLADASAVQLCRDATPLARALDKMASQPKNPIGDPLLAFLLPVLPERHRTDEGFNFGGSTALLPQPCVPSIGDRLSRLRRMGAQYGADARPRTLLRAIGHVILIVLATTLWAFCFGIALLTLAISIFVGAPMAFFMLVLFPHVIMRMLIPWLLGR